MFGKGVKSTGSFQQNIFWSIMKSSGIGKLCCVMEEFNNFTTTLNTCKQRGQLNE
jgi:hypothetical protein